MQTLIHAALMAVVLAVFILSPSLDQFQEYDTVYSLIYLLLGTPVLFPVSLFRYSIAKFACGLNRWAVVGGFAVAAILIGVSYGVLYPIANADNAIGGGSDQDEAYNLAAEALLRGEYPYYPLTYLDNPASGMPGSILLAVPFVLLGNSTYQNLFWLAAMTAVAAWRFRSGGVAFAQLIMLLALCPVVWHSLVTGNDLFANCLFVLIALQLFIVLIPDRGTGVAVKILVAVFLGLTMSSRSNFLLLLPLTAVFVAGRMHWQPMMAYATLSALVFSTVTVPFWLYDPAHFGPAAKQNIYQYFDSAPWARIVMPTTAALVALGACVVPLRQSEKAFWWKCAVIQAVPVFLVTGLQMWQSQWPSFRWMIYGQIYLFFASWAFWLGLSRRVVPTRLGEETASGDQSPNGYRQASGQTAALATRRNEIVWTARRQK